MLVANETKRHNIGKNISHVAGSLQKGYLLRPFFQTPDKIRQSGVLRVLLLLLAHFTRYEFADLDKYTWRILYIRIRALPYTIKPTGPLPKFFGVIMGKKTMKKGKPAITKNLQPISLVFGKK
jgi:hypothetical protein